MSTTELRAMDFVDGNMKRYEEESTELIARAVTARETIESIMDCSTEFDRTVYETARQVVMDNYKELVRQSNDIPHWDDLLQYVEADACESLYDLAQCYWSLHRDERESRQEYVNLLNQGREDEAEQHKEDSISCAHDWICESEYYNYCYSSCYVHYWTGVISLLMDLELPFQIEGTDSGTLDSLEDMPPHISVVINDCQNVLFPTMVRDYTPAFDLQDYNAGAILGVVRRKNVKDALLLEQREEAS